MWAGGATAPLPSQDSAQLSTLHPLPGGGGAGRGGLQGKGKEAALEPRLPWALGGLPYGRTWDSPGMAAGSWWELNLGEHACEFKTGGGPWSWN